MLDDPKTPSTSAASPANAKTQKQMQAPSPTSDEQLTDFGYERVSQQEKTARVGEVFTSVASNYDIMNDLMSLGVHRYWKRIAISMAQVSAHHRILDCAGGSGDLTLAFAKRVRSPGRVVLADINADMLAQGRDKIIDAGLLSKVDVVQANAECLPFQDNYFDRITIAFGLRNVTDKAKAIRSFARVLQPGGRFLVLEFSQPVFAWLRKVYDHYSFSLLPWLGEKVAGDRDAYQYLAESIRKHPKQDDLQNMILQNGFDACEVHNLSGGIVAIHIASKY